MQMRVRDRNENKMHIIKKKQGGDGMNTNLAGSKALMAPHRWDETEYRQQQTAVRTARQQGGGEGGKERGRLTKACPCLPLLPYGGACGRILYLRRSD